MNAKPKNNKEDLEDYLFEGRLSNIAALSLNISLISIKEKTYLYYLWSINHINN